MPGMANISDADPDAHRNADDRLRSFWASKFRPDLGTIQDVGVQIEKALSDFPDTRSVFAERTTGGYFLDFVPKREVAARYGLTVGDVNEIIETAIGGKTISTTVEGRERYPINVRYARDFREDLDSLKRVLVAAPMSGSQIAGGGMNAANSSRADASTPAQIPIGMLADISFKLAHPRSATKWPARWLVFVDITSNEIQLRGRRLKRIKETSRFPGYYINGRTVRVPRAPAETRGRALHVADYFVLIYLNTKARRRRLSRCWRAVSLVGAFWLLPAGLQLEHGSLGRPHRACRTRRRNGRRHAALPRPCVGQIPRRWQDELNGRFAGGGHRRRGATHSPQDHDHLRHPVRPAAHHVVAHDAKRRGRDETHRRADDWRRHHVGYFGAAALPRDLCDLAQTAASRRPWRFSNHASETSVPSMKPTRFFFLFVIGACGPAGLAVRCRKPVMKHLCR